MVPWFSGCWGSLHWCSLCILRRYLIIMLWPKHKSTTSKLEDWHLPTVAFASSLSSKAFCWTCFRPRPQVDMGHGLSKDFLVDREPLTLDNRKQGCCDMGIHIRHQLPFYLFSCFLIAWTASDLTCWPIPLAPHPNNSLTATAPILLHLISCLHQKHSCWYLYN